MGDKSIKKDDKKKKKPKKDVAVSTPVSSALKNKK